MPRPFKCRKVNGDFKVTYFKPKGVPLCTLDEVCLGVDEMEAVRLADLEELYQTDAAEKMNVSRQTFGNIIISAHKKIADALVNGKALKIEGGGPIAKSTKNKNCRHKNNSGEKHKNEL